MKKLLPLLTIIFVINFNATAATVTEQSQSNTTTTSKTTQVNGVTVTTSASTHVSTQSAWGEFTSGYYGYGTVIMGTTSGTSVENSSHQLTSTAIQTLAKTLFLVNHGINIDGNQLSMTDPPIVQKRVYAPITAQQYKEYESNPFYEERIAMLKAKGISLADQYKYLGTVTITSVTKKYSVPAPGKTASMQSFADATSALLTTYAKQGLTPRKVLASFSPSAIMRSLTASVAKIRKIQTMEMSHRPNSNMLETNIRDNNQIQGDQSMNMSGDM